MLEYRHTQRGTLMVYSLGGGGMIAAGISVLMMSLGSSSVRIPGIVGLVLLFCAYLFHSLTVQVSHQRIALRFGHGLIRKSFHTADICDAEIVRNRWYYGWGIKFTPHGWLYSVSGFEAVQIELRNGRKYRIGSDEPKELLAAIRTAIGQDS